MRCVKTVMVRLSAGLLGAALLWSCSSSNSGSLNIPVGIAIDSNGKIYIADFGNNRIIRMDNMNGDNWITYDAANSGQGQFSGPWGIAVDSGFRIYVADSVNKRIVEFDDMNGSNFKSLYADPITTTDQFSFPEGIAVDSSGHIYVADAKLNRIVQVNDITGSIWTVLNHDPANNTDTFNAPAGVAVDGSGKIYVADYSNNRIVQVDNIGGTNWTTLGGTASGSGTKQFSSPASITVNSGGSLIYVADSLNDRIVQMTDISGNDWSSIGTIGSGINHFNNPYGVAVGNINSFFSIYASDTGNNGIVAMTDITGTSWTTYP
ncbi:MAG TPA: NHL repeat-containing protein [Nitrospiria bacterium]|nr:NHL repeat-containing protein [Nitrospiria bacterium]